MNDLQQLALSLIPEQYHEHFRYSFEGGKRIRPLIMEAVCGYLQQNVEPLTKAGVGLELFHSSTLLHDDVLDQDATRREKPAFFKQFSLKQAILYGDYFALRAIRLFQEEYPKLLPAALTAVDALVQGQLMEFQPLTSLTHWEEYATKKTASLFTLAVDIPCIFAGVDRPDIHDWGTQFGVAFQIANDLKKSQEEHSILGFLSREKAVQLLTEKQEALAALPIAFPEGVLGSRANSQ